MTNIVKVNLWGTAVGYLKQNEFGIVSFQYDDEFLESGIEISPIYIPLSTATYSFPTLSRETFAGLPGTFADSLPDRFGNAVLTSYLSREGKNIDSLSVLDRLCYTGVRGMGALEYEPAKDIKGLSNDINVDALAELAAEVLSQKENLHIEENDEMMSQLYQAGSSVGGARAKALIAWNKETGVIRSGQVNAGKGFEYWLLKFDGIDNNKDKDAVPDEAEYTKVEYAYYLAAKEAGINMSECQLYKEKGKSHFITKRFDRIGQDGQKLHMQTLGAIAHLDFNQPKTSSYEEAINVMRELNLPSGDVIQFYRRMVFNDVFMNYDDHVKNISFLMDKNGQWKLSPAYDVTFSYNPHSTWVSSHQMLINSKKDNITKNDLLAVAKFANISKSVALDCIDKVICAASRWNDFAEQAELSKNKTDRIKKLLKCKY